MTEPRKALEQAGAPWTLIDAEAVKGRRMTSWPTLKIDLTNAGANWVDEEVVRDGQIVTGRKPADIPAFNEKMIKLFAEAHQRAKGTFSRWKRIATNGLDLSCAD